MNIISEIASFSILSPKIKAYKFGSVSVISLKIARTATGSVAEINEPNAIDSNRLISVAIPITPAKYINKDVKIAAKAVPKIAKIKMLPKFLKKLFFSILIALIYVKLFENNACFEKPFK